MILTETLFLFIEEFDDVEKTAVSWMFVSVNLSSPSFLTSQHQNFIRP